MTIITKTSNGKKEDIGVLPLFHAQDSNQVEFKFSLEKSLSLSGFTAGRPPLSPIL